MPIEITRKQTPAAYLLGNGAPLYFPRAIVAKKPITCNPYLNRVMILEAFAEFLHRVPELPANQALSLWLWERLKKPPSSAVDQVIHCEVDISSASGRQSPPLNLGRKIRLPQEAEMVINAQKSGSKIEIGPEVIYFFEGASSSGIRLLNSLYEYSMSYEQQKWSRFVHGVKASDFKSND